MARSFLGRSGRRHDIRPRVDGPGIDSERIAAKVATISSVSNVAWIPAVSHTVRIAPRLVSPDLFSAHLFSARLIATRDVTDEVGSARQFVAAAVSEVVSPIKVSAVEAVPVPVSITATIIPFAPLVTEGAAAAMRAGRAKARRVRDVGVCGVGAAVAWWLSGVPLGAVRVDLAGRVLASVDG